MSSQRSVLGGAVAPGRKSLVAGFPRESLGFYPTPLVPMENLSRSAGGPRLFVKRDDCTGLAMGGNKVRQLEFVLGDALAKGADTVISSSAVQSNHLRVLAAAAAKLGLACEILREKRVPNVPKEYYLSGNVLLQDLFGAKSISRAGTDDDAATDRELAQMAARVRSRDGKPYVIGVGIDNPLLGALGYVEAAAEILHQLADQDMHVDAIVVPSGSAATHAGTLVGLRALGSDIRVFGICVRRDSKQQSDRVLRRALEVAAMVGLPGLIGESDIWVSDEYLGPGYGLPTEATLATIRLAARTEGLLLDPVYSGKAMTGLLGLIKQNVFKPDATVVFLHTGGTPALFAYGSIISPPTVSP